MLFLVTGVDSPDSLDKRLANRWAHIAYLNALGAKLKIGGAILSDDLMAPVGSMLILEGESEAEIQAILAEDPYTVAGLWESVTVRPWLQAVGQPLA
jgi:uncharacterized protein